MTFLFIEHDMEVVMGHSDKVIVMAEGRVIAQGPPDEVRSDQRVIDAYLGGAAPSDRKPAMQRERRDPLRPRTWSPATCPRSTS